MTRVRPLDDFLQLFTGPVIWFAHFVTLYGAEALICTPGLASAGTMAWAAGAVTLAALAALGGFGIMVMRRPAHDPAGSHTGATFLRRATLLLAMLSAIAVVWVALPVAVLPVCASAAG
jgi:uncharacterized membrane-anchored protein